MDDIHGLAIILQIIYYFCLLSALFTPVLKLCYNYFNYSLAIFHAFRYALYKGNPHEIDYRFILCVMCATGLCVFIFKLHSLVIFIKLM